MNLRSLSRRRALGAALALGALSVSGRACAADDPAVVRVRAFYDALLDSMKTAAKTPVRTRDEKLAPAVRAAFDLPAMTRIAVGSQWSTLSPADQQAVTDAFSRFTIATYANRFDGYSGERFEVDPGVEARGENRVVKTRLVKSNGEPVTLNYLAHATPDGWKAIDVYLSGTISELATRRSEFGSLLRSGGAAALVESLRKRTDRLLGDG